MSTSPAGMPGSIRLILRLEGLAVAIAAIFAYRATGEGWGLFALVILAPDLSMAGYLAGPGIGAGVYNVAHSYLGPALLVGAGLALAGSPAVAVALVWIAHIGFDRALGYGLKYPHGFDLTHLGPIGNRRADGDQNPAAD